jgi:hypothetical protein
MGSVAWLGYGWKLSPSIRGRVRWLARYHAPSAARKRTGDVETLLVAEGLSLPRGERPSPTTRMEGSTALRASYPAARKAPARAAETFVPSGLNWGRRNAG